MVETRNGEARLTDVDYDIFIRFCSWAYRRDYWAAPVKDRPKEQIIIRQDPLQGGYLDKSTILVPELAREQRSKKR